MTYIQNNASQCHVGYLVNNKFHVHDLRYSQHQNDQQKECYESDLKLSEQDTMELQATTPVHS